MSVAIAHDQMKNRGGAERVAFELARTFDAPIFAAEVDQTIVPEDVEAREISQGRVGNRLMSSHYLLQDCYQMQRWQHVSALHEFDTIIQNKTNPWWYVPKDTQTIVRYVHSTPRGLFDQFHRHGEHWLHRLVKTPMRSLFAQTVPYADGWMCNSELVARRLERYIGVDDAAVVYPPVDTSGYDPALAEDGGYYLTVSRLRGHKRIDEIIRAFNGLSDQFDLVVCGDGPQRDSLEQMAGANVDIRGYVNEKEKRRLMAGAEAFVMNAENEDFGMTPIEAFASGTPVIGVNEGYTRHQVRHGGNGVLFDRGDLTEAVRAFYLDGVAWSPEKIAEHAQKYAASEFRAGVRDVVETAQKRAAISRDHPEPPVAGQSAAYADGGNWL